MKIFSMVCGSCNMKKLITDIIGKGILKSTYYVDYFVNLLFDSDFNNRVDLKQNLLEICSS